MFEAFKERMDNFEIDYKHVVMLNQYLATKLEEHNIQYKRTIPSEISSPFIFSMVLSKDADHVLQKLFDKDIYISKRSACSSQAHQKSRILESILMPSEEIDRVVRVSFSSETTIEELDVLTSTLAEILAA